MPLTEAQLQKRDASRNLGEELLQAIRDVKAGEVASPANVRSVRPGGGLPPKEIDRVFGQTFSTDAAKGTPVSWDLF